MKFKWNFLETLIQSVQRRLNLLFERTLFLMLPLFQKYLNLQVRNNKLVNSFVYHSCPSRLASGKHPYFFKLLRDLSLSRMLVEFSDLYISPCVGKIFQFMKFTLENALNLGILLMPQLPSQNSRYNFLKRCFAYGQEQRGEENYDLLY